MERTDKQKAEIIDELNKPVPEKLGMMTFHTYKQGRFWISMVDGEPLSMSSGHSRIEALACSLMAWRHVQKRHRCPDCEYFLSEENFIDGTCPYCGEGLPE